MCFSASASFGAGVVLSVIGVAAIRKVQRPSQFAFASIPLIFAIQQISEGFVWLSLIDPFYASLEMGATYSYLFFAQIVWPLFVPLAFLYFEKDDKPKIFGKILVAIGAIVSFYLTYCLFAYHVQAKNISYHIAYEQDYPELLSGFGILFYVVATIVPPFLSRLKYMWVLGVAILVSYIITYIFYTDYLTSVWCFFASIISITLFVIMHQIEPMDKEARPIEVR
jgi:hypothetical protein